MDLQEYQKVVSEICTQAEWIGTVHRNITLPDKETGQPRQMDTWVEVDVKGHKLGMFIDAKFYQRKIGVKVVEEVESLARAVGASKTFIVCPNGWTKPAEKRASSSGMDLRLMALERVVELLEPHRWHLCPVCKNDCIVRDHEGAIETDGLFLWWLAGQCRQCKAGIVGCQDCGDKAIIEVGEEYECHCGHRWKVMSDGMQLKLGGSDRYLVI